MRPGGGRAPVDWGQHLMLGCYGATRALVERLGTTSRLRLVREATPFLSGPDRVHGYRAGALPAPLHLLPGLVQLTQLAWRDRIALGRVVLAAKLALRLRRAQLDGWSVATWLRRHGQSDAAIAGFWEPLTVATLNAPVEEASALLLAVVVDRVFSGERDDAVPLLPRGTYHELLVAPALHALSAKGAVVRLGEAVVSLERGRQGEVASVRTSAGRTLSTDAVVLAVPHGAVGPLLEPFPALAELRRAAASLGDAPIVGIDLWFDRDWMAAPFVGLLGGGPVQWVFRGGGRAPEGHRVSLVTSHATELLGRRNHDLVAMGRRELARFFPASARAKLLHDLIVKEPRATFRASPGTAALRPPTRTGVPNLFLAGDWTATGLPATIEGAVVSGERAADAVLRAARTA